MSCALLLACMLACADASSTVVTMAAYATGAGSTSRESRDGAVRNGFFTAALLHHLRSSGATMGIRQLLPAVKATVIDAVEAVSGGVQVPEIRDGLSAEDVIIAPTRSGAGAGAGAGGDGYSP